jgi:hypothetical protein
VSANAEELINAALRRSKEGFMDATLSIVRAEVNR